MLREPKIDLKKAIELGQAAEQTKQHAKHLSNQMDRSLNKITCRNKKSKKQSVAAAAPSDTEEKQHKSDRSRMIKHCKFCAGSHTCGRCAAFGQKCNKCHRKNHFAKCCTKKVREIEEDIDFDSVEFTSDDEFYIGSVTGTQNE